MTNTYMRPGPHAREEIIRSVERGIYAVNFGGGQVDITSGKFVFSASEAYAIENGKLGAPLKGATLIGNGPDVLTRVSMVGNDLKLDEGVGTCGKEGPERARGRRASPRCASTISRSAAPADTRGVSASISARNTADSRRRFRAGALHSARRGRQGRLSLAGSRIRSRTDGQARWKHAFPAPAVREVV